MQKVGFLLFLLFISNTLLAQSKATQNLFKAIEKNNLSQAQNAIKEGADPDGVDNLKAPSTTVLLKAVQLNRPEIVELLLNHHANVNIQRPVDLHTPLMLAARHDHSQIANLLIQRGADVNIQTLLARTALHISALYNSVATAEVLLKARDIDVNVRPKLCALAVAARQGHTGIVLLLKRQTGAKVSSPVCVDKATEVARHNQHEQIVSILNRN
ncbi:MAG: ankyrin repeat domain-containing protein [Bdellovibrionales bacterium]|nr:ankyrin repeat domain-containing protein [Bdellovibrionales bacterium]